MENKAKEDGFDRYGEAAIDPDRDAAFFNAHRAQLMDAYEGRYVAIRGGEVVADADSYFELYANLCRRDGEPAYAFIRKVAPASFVVPGTDPAYLVF